MGRLSLRILLLTLLSLLQYASAAEVDISKSEKIADCPPHTACTIWGKLACGLHADETTRDRFSGFLYKNASSCDWKAMLNGYGDGYIRPAGVYSDKYYARFDITPVDAHNWSFAMIIWTRTKNDQYAAPGKDGGIDNQNVHNVGFGFGNARITFPEEKKAKFEWRKTDADAWSSSMHKLKYERQFKAHEMEFVYKQYSFNISSKEVLFKHFAKNPFTFLRYRDLENIDEASGMIFDDDRFIGILEEALACDPDELNRVCIGSCDEMSTEITNSSTINTCDSSFWFHNSNDSTFTREWKAVDAINCREGKWEAEWNGGSQFIDKTYEVQCAADKPAKLTNTTYGVIGFSVFMFIVAAGVVGFFMWRVNRRRREARSRSDAPTFSTPSTPGMGSSRRPQPPAPPPRPDA